MKRSKNESGYRPEVHGPFRVVGPGFHEDVFEMVQQVPAGSVTTYGDIAAALGRRGVARQVGYALAALPSKRKDVPWYRVVNSRGEISVRADGKPSHRQKKLLRQEGVEVNSRGRIVDFAQTRYDWEELDGAS